MVKRLLIYTVLVLVAATSCRHKDLCILHPHTAPLKINVDWEEFIEKEVPTGMTVIVYPQDGSAPVITRSHELSHVLVYLPAGMYNSLVFNQSETEFGSLELKNLSSYSTAEVVAVQAPTRWYKTRGDEEKVVHEPEWFGTDNEINAEVTEEMIEQTKHDIYTENMNGNGRSSTKGGIDLIFHKVENVIYTLNVNVHIKNAYNLRSARGAIAGMSEGFKLAESARSNNKVTHLMENWGMESNPADPTQGTITTKILCFGLPQNHNKGEDENTLTLSLLLVDNQTILNYTFKVGDLIKEDEILKKTLHLTLEIPDPLPDVKPEDGESGGFDATVEDWGDEIEHNVTI